ncbi:MAG: hypothetical protein NTW87_10160 [Planctomycetota bacterium]|nr:hypothetical protein [Planctomycetota bacterium]
MQDEPLVPQERRDAKALAWVAGGFVGFAGLCAVLSEQLSNRAEQSENAYAAAALVIVSLCAALVLGVWAFIKLARAPVVGFLRRIRLAASRARVLVYLVLVVFATLLTHAAFCWWLGGVSRWLSRNELPLVVPDDWDTSVALCVTASNGARRVIGLYPEWAVRLPSLNWYKRHPHTEACDRLAAEAARAGWPRDKVFAELRAFHKEIERLKTLNRATRDDVRNALQGVPGAYFPTPEPVWCALELPASRWPHEHLVIEGGFVEVRLRKDGSRTWMRGDSSQYSEYYNFALLLDPERKLTIIQWLYTGWAPNIHPPPSTIFRSLPACLAAIAWFWLVFLFPSFFVSLAPARSDES